MNITPSLRLEFQFFMTCGRNWFLIVCLREYLMLQFSGEKEKRGLQLRTMKVCY